MDEWLWFVAGGAAGAGLLWALLGRRAGAAQAALAAETARREAAETQLAEARAAASEMAQRLGAADARVAEAQRLAAEQSAFLDKARRDFEATFQALAAAVLQGSSEQFLKLAEQRLATAQTQAVADAEERKKAIETLVAPLRETLGKLETRTVEIEKARESAYSKIGEQLKSLGEATLRAERGTSTLATALRGSQVRGRWGEVALRNVVEISGMTEHCDFDLQTTTATGNRPDMTVRLPGGRRIAVDAKVPLIAYLASIEGADDEARERGLVEHVAALRGHVRALKGRDYQSALGAGVDLVVLFLPADAFLSAAFARDPELQSEALRMGVLIATPTTLVALLRTVAIYHQQQALARNAEEIASTARELYERGAKFGEDLAKVGERLQSAMRAYNEAVGSFDARFIPMGRRLEELSVTEQSKRVLEAPATIDEVPRAVRALPRSA